MEEEKENFYYYLRYPVTNDRIVGFYGRNDLKKGDRVIADTVLGKDVLVVISSVAQLPKGKTAYEILRYAENSEIDFSKFHRDEEVYYTDKTKEILKEFDLDMKIVDSHLLPLSSDLVIFFTSDRKLDFRELVRRLVKEFKMHIMLRQINQRDEARFYNVCGPCGQILCCNRVSSLTKRSQVSIKSLKEQGLVLNSYKLMGICDRFMCCVAFEEQFYRDSKDDFPVLNEEVVIKDTPFHVKEVNYVSGKIKFANKDFAFITLDRSDIRKGSDGKWVLNDEVED